MALYAAGLTLGAVSLALVVRPGTAKKHFARVKAKCADVGRPLYTKVDIYQAALNDGFVDRA